LCILLFLITKVYHNARFKKRKIEHVTYVDKMSFMWRKVTLVIVTIGLLRRVNWSPLHCIWPQTCAKRGSYIHVHPDEALLRYYRTATPPDIKRLVSKSLSSHCHHNKTAVRPAIKSRSYRLHALETRVRIQREEWPTEVLYCQTGHDNNNDAVSCVCQCAVCVRHSAFFQTFNTASRFLFEEFQEANQKRPRFTSHKSSAIYTNNPSAVVSFYSHAWRSE
jgi:hypothetical protein